MYDNGIRQKRADFEVSTGSNLEGWGIRQKRNDFAFTTGTAMVAMSCIHGCFKFDSLSFLGLENRFRTNGKIPLEGQGGAVEVIPTPTPQ